MPEAADPKAANPYPSRRPDPAPGARNFVLVILDSLRYDTCVEAAPRVMRGIGEIERRHSYATWTAPSHFNLLMGLLPHRNRADVLAAATYRADYDRYSERLGIEGLSMASLLPHLFLPTLLREHLGYVTNAYVSMPVLNPYSLLNRDFDRYELMPNHHDLPGMIEQLHFSSERPNFHLLNVGETHYPFSFEGDDGSDLPHISGLHGAVKSVSRQADVDSAIPFTPAELAELRDRQVKSVRYVDTLLEHLLDVVPRNTSIVVTSDHGELFGEDGFFGHGPMAHELLLEVPYVEGFRD